MLRRSRLQRRVSQTKCSCSFFFFFYTSIFFAETDTRNYFIFLKSHFLFPFNSLSLLEAKFVFEAADMFAESSEQWHTEAAGCSPDWLTPVSLIFTVARHRRRARQSTAGVWRRSERPVWRVSHQTAKTRPDERLAATASNVHLAGRFRNSAMKTSAPLDRKLKRFISNNRSSLNNQCFFFFSFFLFNIPDFSFLFLHPGRKSDNL